MKVSKIEISFWAIVGLLIAFGQIRINVAQFSYTQVVTSLTNPDWKGAPYIIKQLRTKDRCFEDLNIRFAKKSYISYDNTLKHYPYFMTQISIPEGNYYSHGTEHEICIEFLDQKLSVIKNRFFRKQYDLEILYDVSYFSIRSHINPTYNFEIKFNSSIAIDGLASKLYSKEMMREFSLHKSLELLNEYLNPELQHQVSSQ